MTPILMSRENPTGWKLEELAAELRHEINAKSLNIIEDVTVTGEIIRTNNNKIVELLAQIESIQHESLRELLKIVVRH
ncbi:hypothetical protein [Vibrio harveyi]|uniref:hypothetical protein n=1 Tax=Vibrio harveyi TaxID=669 RepID=UPI00034B707B|nr:hypothetical protein [Vibrio harveyi]GEA22289.1 hypothetical protein VH1807_contig00024-0007 [Vibrio harveyi]